MYPWLEGLFIEDSDCGKPVLPPCEKPEMIAPLRTLIEVLVHVLTVRNFLLCGCRCNCTENSEFIEEHTCTAGFRQAMGYLLPTVQIKSWIVYIPNSGFIA